MTRIRVLVADDHETVRHGLKLLLDAQPDMEVVGEAGDGAAAVRSVAALRPAVAVLDISMPEMNGLEAAREIASRAPGTAIVVLTRYADAAYVDELLRAGASGYVLKQSAASELLSAIRAAAQGRNHIDAHLDARAALRVRLSRAGEPREPKVTERETEVLRLMARGLANKEIAAALDVSVKTVEVHKSNGMRKLGLGGRTDLIKYALLQGWLRDM